MKKNFMKSICLLLVGCLLSLTATGCYGRFALTRKIYQVNGSIGDKWGDSVFTWILLIPYGICAVMDLALFNVIQFWTGRNPIAMGPEDRDTQLVFQGNRMYEITATRNRFDITEFTDSGRNKTAGLVYDPEMKTWYAESLDGGKIRVAEMEPSAFGPVHFSIPMAK
ncbi:MAG: DUF3332 family protein [Desulfobacteraceae bacterium]|nr:DUF3332 family protein [Desulfobacteraceae bacterium]